MKCNGSVPLDIIGSCHNLNYRTSIKLFVCTSILIYSTCQDSFYIRMLPMYIIFGSSDHWDIIFFGKGFLHFVYAVHILHI